MTDLERPSQRHRRSRGDSELFREFQKLKPLYSSTEEAIKGTTRKLEELAAQNRQSVEALLREAHTTPNTQPHHIQALTYQRMLAFLRR